VAPGLGILLSGYTHLHFSSYPLDISDLQLYLPSQVITKKHALSGAKWWSFGGPNLEVSARMAKYTWLATPINGIRFREHEERKHGVKKDRFYQLRYMSEGKRSEESLGWASQG